MQRLIRALNTSHLSNVYIHTLSILTHSCATHHLRMCNDPFEHRTDVLSISIGLFCKRDLRKRRYSFARLSSDILSILDHTCAMPHMYMYNKPLAHMTRHIDTLSLSKYYPTRVGEVQNIEDRVLKILYPQYSIHIVSMYCCEDRQDSILKTLS